MTTTTSKLTGRKIAIMNFNGSTVVKYLPQMKKFENQFYRYDGEPFQLVVVYRDAYNYRVFHNRKELKGSDLGQFNDRHFELSIKQRGL